MNRQIEFENNVRDNRSKLLSFLYTKLGSRFDAEDALQRAFLIMWNKYDTFDAQTDFMKWAFAIAYNESRNYRRSKMRCPVIFDDDVFDDVSKNYCSTTVVEKEDMYDKLKMSLNKLDSDSRQLLISVYVNGEEIKDLAKRKGKAPQTYYNKLNLARKKLLEYINL